MSGKVRVRLNDESGFFNLQLRSKVHGIPDWKEEGLQFQKMNESGEWWTRVGLEAALDGLVLQGSFSPNSDQRISTVGWDVPQYGSELALYLRYSGR